MEEKKQLTFGIFRGCVTSVSPQATYKPFYKGKAIEFLGEISF